MGSMGTTILVLTLTFSMPWGTGLSGLEASVSPDIWIGDDPTNNAIVSPLELTWSPESGFGATSSVTVSQTAAEE